MCMRVDSYQDGETLAQPQWTSDAYSNSSASSCNLGRVFEQGSRGSRAYDVIGDDWSL